MVPELKKQKDKLEICENPHFLKKGFVADAAFLTNYKKITKFIKEHENLSKTGVSPHKSEAHFAETLSSAPQNKQNATNFMNSHSQAFENHLTNKNLSDTHANSKGFFPIHKDLQFTDMGEMNKHKSNANNFFLQQSQNRQNFPNFYENPTVMPEYTPEKNIYPGSVMKNPALDEFFNNERNLMATKNQRLKQNIESLGGIEDTVASLFYFFWFF